MADVQTLKREIKVCMFDQYGTVVDMQAGLTEAATEFLVPKGWQETPISGTVRGTWLELMVASG